MLDAVVLLSKGGLVLWQRVFVKQVLVNGSDVEEEWRWGLVAPVEQLMRTVIAVRAVTKLPTLGETVTPLNSSLESATINEYALKWLQNTAHQLIVIGVYQKVLQLNYVADVLEHSMRVFTELFESELKSNNLALIQDQAPRRFDGKFTSILTQLENRAHKGSKKVDSNEETAELEEKLESVKLGKKSKKKSLAKGKRVWNADGTTATESDGSVRLDFSNTSSVDDVRSESSAIMNIDMNKVTEAKQRNGGYDLEDFDAQDADFVSLQVTSDKESLEKAPSRIMGFFQSITGQRKITREDLIPLQAHLKEHLVAKNVASDIAESVCQSIATGLLGQKLSTFQSVQAALKSSAETALHQILHSGARSDLLQEIELFRQQSKQRPFVICFIGVNGVGKSTNLSKCAFWLLQRRLKILIAACDTFRSGAVEQLRVHVKNLMALQVSANEQGTVMLFEKGYGKDAASIAKEAIAFATREQFDVVLIDTAGRMQDNEPLMRALAKLVTVNQPDRLLFVGEALVGNEAVDQLTKFNAALRSYTQPPRQIDGLILSKFDTIDDQVGAALTMTCTSRAPIVFVGTGQTYTDLKRLNAKAIVTALLK